MHSTGQMSFAANNILTRQCVFRSQDNVLDETSFPSSFVHAPRVTEIPLIKTAMKNASKAVLIMSTIERPLEIEISSSANGSQE